jgi:hypothetical protein
VEVALQPPAFTVGGGHEPRAGLVHSPSLALWSHDGHLARGSMRPSRSAGACKT